MREGIHPIGDERGGEQGTGNNAQQIHTPIVRYLCPRGKPNGPDASQTTGKKWCNAQLVVVVE